MFELVNTCIHESMQLQKPEAIIQYILQFIATKFGCGRCYVFEKDESGNSFTNTYEWCNENVSSQLHQLQKEPIETFSWWFDELEEKQFIVIENVEQIKNKYPSSYATVKSQDIHSLISVPLYVGDEIKGFVGVDNPSTNEIENLVAFLRVISNYLLVEIKNRDLQKKMEYISMHDPLTGSYNRYAFQEDTYDISKCSSIGVIYCDITELKKINDHYGHAKGNELILHWYRVLNEIFYKDRVYRLGGDEFIVLCRNVDQKNFHDLVEKLRNKIVEDKYHLAIGFIWSDSKEKNIQDLMKDADRFMYDDKKRYYVLLNSNSRRHSLLMNKVFSSSTFAKFITNNYFDTEFFLKSLSNSQIPFYIFVGDLQSNIFYISDNMKQKFGFDDNIVLNLLTQWRNRIYREEDLQQYDKQIKEIMEGKCPQHDLKYQVKDCHGNVMWIHCQGKIKWDPETKQPLFFAGTVSHQEYDFIIDKTTNFPREQLLLKKMLSPSNENAVMYAVGFSLNNVRMLNEALGRKTTDSILRQIAYSLYEEFSSPISFFRLDGMRFMALYEAQDIQEIKQFMSNIHRIVKYYYNYYGVNIENPCSIGYLKCHPGDKPEDILEKILNVIRFAKNELNKEYVEYSDDSIYSYKEDSMVILSLNQDITNNMHNFRLMIQPIVDRKTQRIIGGETLLRWKYKNKNISPQRFVPMLEKNKLIIKVGKWVLDQALKNVNRIRCYDPNFSISVNVSYIQICEEDLYTYIKNTLEKYKLPGSVLILELTETRFDEYPEKLQVFIERCQSIGIRFALDDFGNAYSSLSLLFKYSANIVKLDKSLLKEVHNSKDNEKLLKAIVSACHEFGKKVCMEGVETKEELNLTENVFADTLQGYYFYKPMEIQDFYEVMSSKYNEKN